jgi:lipopolysaccharide biosynthesis glycosyltransferase
MIQIATSCTPNYLPGVRALYNSIMMHHPDDAIFTIFYYDGISSQQKYLHVLEELENKENIVILKNKEMLGKIIDTGTYRKNGGIIGPDMYARLIIPKWMSGRVFYIDADCVLLNSISELWKLDLGNYYSACVPRKDIGWIGGHVHDDMASGTILIECDKWNKFNIVEKCFDIMESGKVNFVMNVESVLSYIHNKNFYHLSPAYQNLAYYGSLKKTDKIIHWGGPKPWAATEDKKNNLKSSRKLNYKKLWEAYNNLNKNEIKKQIEMLPE